MLPSIATLRIAIACLVLALGGCAVTKDVKEMKRLQDNEGYFTQSLFYRGSSKTYHYFDQQAGWNFSKTYLALIPFMETDGITEYRVPRDQLRVSKKLFFRYGSTKIPKEERNLKVRIKDQPDYHLEPRGDETKEVVARRAKAKRNRASSGVSENSARH